MYEWLCASEATMQSSIDQYLNTVKHSKAYTVYTIIHIYIAGLIPGSHLDNAGRRYKVTPSLIGWAQT